MTSPPDPLQPRFPAPPATVSRERVKRPPKPNFCSGWKTKRREGTACDRSFSQHYAPRAAGRAPLAVPARRSALVQGHPPWRGRYRPASTHGCGPGVKPAPAPSRTDLTGRAEWRVDACGSRAAGQPAPPAGIRAASPRQRRGRAVGHRPGPPRARPAGLPFRQGRAARHVAVSAAAGRVLGWVAASPVSSRCVYAGVVEHSVYVDPGHHGRGIGGALLAALVASSEDAGIWTIQSGVFP